MGGGEEGQQAAPTHKSTFAHGEELRQSIVKRICEIQGLPLPGTAPDTIVTEAIEAS